MKKIEFDFGSNMGGLSRMFAIPPECVLRIRTDHTNDQNYLEVINREKIVDIYFTEETSSFSELQSRDTPGSAYKIEISAIVPKDSPTNKKVMTQLEHGFWYVLAEDNNGNIRLAGNEDNQLIFTRKGGSGTGPSSGNKTEILFSGNQRVPCIFITLEDMDEL